jgi:hypothetical protein
MCLRNSSIRPYQKWYWAGNKIVNDASIPASRLINIDGKLFSKYPIDIREFLSNENNSVIRNLLDGMISALPIKDQLKFYKNKKGNFDFRVRKCKEFFSKFEYKSSGKGFDSWQFPEETVLLKSGDCEDLAFLLASMIAECGISQFCLRVALGKVTQYTGDQKREWDHAWVVYQNEGGGWEIVEPLIHTSVTSEKYEGESTINSASLLEYEYFPYFVFNNEHLWQINSSDMHPGIEFQGYVTKKIFNKFRPEFALGAHYSIFKDALKGISSLELYEIDGYSTVLDGDTLDYDPRDHFDFAYIKDGWDLVNSRLKSKVLKDFAYAVHSVGDFYAHSTWGLFTLKDGIIPVFTNDSLIESSSYKYNNSIFDNSSECQCTPEQIQLQWNGKLISGKWLRWYNHIPGELKNRPDYNIRKCLPDHDHLAVDSEIFTPGANYLIPEVSF